MKQTLLIIEDDPDILESITTILENEGYQVASSASSRNVLEKISDIKPSLIILDYLLGAENGGQVCKRIKQQKDTQNIPIIMISAHPSASKSAKEAGVDYFLAKPFDVDELIVTVKQFMV